ncbi:M16 family metallopeptidase [Chelatococcus asaccharovorans]|uniref:Putative Zn-dependent peptidase n=1 Tax=Chelatococcus asaccharovorans TaxID=28210 RepID=A0A2V3U362_9HYPH|nr:pitrilysin family protein [Chelatococcus asaccharovorans]MBS7702318.1 insulinase family protein [Chelatococcus asaccharovorans]PXW56480.1 putative Zn-dependent peptidase [Chelatococcus asaccharovorans]CAH1669545.1 Mitochondrial processing peptidase-like protein [Chelatococcus asaccharovorans]CAH1678997.1 Mitochondrial processing peptidase-like protein [Chelatococcus asaccharovorans]
MNLRSPSQSDTDVRVTTLASGLRVATERFPHVATAAVGVWVGTGSRHEGASEHGLSHLLEHMAFKGTRRRSARAIAEAIEAVGGDLNAETGIEHTAYTARVMAADVDLALDILADIIIDSVIDAAELEREKAVILQEIGAVEDTPDDLINDLFLEGAFTGQPLGRPILGTPATVAGFDPDAVKRFLSREYRAGRMVVAAAGAVDHEAIVATVEKLFAGLSPGRAAVPAPAEYRGGTEVRLDRDLEQVHVLVGFAGASFLDDAFYPLQVFANLLGGGMSSRLFQEVREARGLAYAVEAFHWSFADAGVFGLSAATAPEDLAELMPVALDCLRDAAVNVTDAEIARAKAQLRVAHFTALESPASRVEQIARQLIALDRVLPSAEVVSRLEAVTAKDVRAAAAALTASPPILAAIGALEGLPPLGRITEQLFPPRVASGPVGEG